MSVPVLIGVVGTLIGLQLALLVHAITIARWSARIQTLVELHQSEVTALRGVTQDHGLQLATLRGQVEEHLERRQGPDHNRG